MDRYEYYKLDMDSTTYEAVSYLNKLGADGWVMCGIHVNPHLPYTTSYYFMRKIESNT